MLESEMEDLLWKYPDKFLEPLKQFRRQPRSAVGRADLVFEDRLGRLLVVEIKRGQLKRGAIDQVHDYFGMIKIEFPHKPVEMMVIAQSIPPERKVALELYNIEYREISDKRFRDVAMEMGYSFESERGSTACISQRSDIVASESDCTETMASRSEDPLRRRRGSTGRKEPELIAALSAYHLIAESGMGVRPGMAKNYSQIAPPGWKVADLHYEFYQARGLIGAELHLTQRLDQGKVVSIGKLLKTFDGRTVANGERKLTIIERHRNPCLAALFRLPDPPEAVAKAMRDLISMTVSAVAQHL
jgi:hypothetical protein